MLFPNWEPKIHFIVALLCHIALWNWVTFAPSNILPPVQHQIINWKKKYIATIFYQENIFENAVCKNDGYFI